MAVPAVRLDDLQLTVVPGEGLVGRFGEVALLALVGRKRRRDRSTARDVPRLGRARMDEPGAILVDQLDALLGERMPASPSFCVLATSAEGVEVVLCGEVEVTVARGGQVSRHAGPDPDTWVDLLVDEGFDWLVAVPIGSAEPPSDVRLDLHDGVVPGGGLRLTQRDRLPGEAAAMPRAGGRDGRAGPRGPSPPWRRPGPRPRSRNRAAGSCRCPSSGPRSRRFASRCRSPRPRSTSPCPSLTPCSCRRCGARRDTRTTQRPPTAPTAAGRSWTAPPACSSAPSPRSGS